jgi:hypothetical protein
VVLVSGLLSLIVLIVASVLHRRPSEFEDGSEEHAKHKRFPKMYWLYFAAGTLIAAGFPDFSLIAFHFQKSGTVFAGSRSGVLRRGNGHRRALLRNSG